MKLSFSKTTGVARIFLISGGFVLTVSLIFFGLSCGQQTTMDKWAGDGVIFAREYTRAKTFDDFELLWASDDKYVYIAMKVKTTGWVSVGVQPGSGMRDADMVFGFVKDGKAIVYDQFFSTTTHSSDTDLGGTNDIIEFGGKEEGGYTIIEFKRALVTSDKYDKPLTKGVNKIIWAYGTDDSLTSKHAKRGYGQMELP